MQKMLLSLGSMLLLTLGNTSSVHAIQAALIYHSDVPWSQVTANPFDGEVVYDRHFTSNFVFVSTWSRQGIRATYTEIRTEIAGYQSQTTYKPTRNRQLVLNHHGKLEWRDVLVNVPTTQLVPVLRETRSNYVPQKILFAIAGQTYAYEGGAVSPELAAALANAPSGNMRIWLVWSSDGTTETGATDLEIGKRTVEAWRTIFRSSR